MTESSDRADAETVESSVRRRIVWGYVGGAALIVVAVLLAWWAIATGAATAGPSTSTASSPAASSSPAGSTAASSAPPSEPASATTEPSASAEAPEDAGAAAPASPLIDAFAVSTTTAECADDRSATVPLSFTWSATGGDEAWIGVGTTDASAVPSTTVPLTSSGYADLVFSCRDEEQIYTLTVRGPGGTTSSSVTVARSLL